MGVTWMIPIAGAYLAVTLPPGDTGWRPLARRLVAYAFLVRGMVALTSVVATRLGLGTHYDVSSLTVLALGLTGHVYTFAPASWQQLLWLTLLPQLVAWPAVTLLIGLLGGIAAQRLLPGAHSGRRRMQAGRRRQRVAHPPARPGTPRTPGRRLAGAAGRRADT